MSTALKRIMVFINGNLLGPVANPTADPVVVSSIPPGPIHSLRLIMKCYCQLQAVTSKSRPTGLTCPGKKLWLGELTVSS